MEVPIHMKQLEGPAFSDLLHKATAWFAITQPGAETNNNIFNKLVERFEQSHATHVKIAQSCAGLDGSRLIFYMNKNMLYAVMLPSYVFQDKDIGEKC